MDQSAKTYLQILTIFVGAFLILGVVSYYFRAAEARNAAYSVVEYIEIYGYDAESERRIEKFSEEKNLVISVETENEGIHGDGGKYRYRVTVCFEHMFAITKSKRLTGYTLYTRAVEY